MKQELTEKDIKKGSRFKDFAGNYYVVKNISYDDYVNFDYVSKDNKLIFNNSLYMVSFLPKLRFTKCEKVN